MPDGADFDSLKTDEVWHDDDIRELAGPFRAAMDVMAHATLSEWQTKYNFCRLSSSPALFQDMKEMWDQTVSEVVEATIQLAAERSYHVISQKHPLNNQPNPETSGRCTLATTYRPRYTYVDLEHLGDLGDRYPDLGQLEELQDTYEARLREWGRTDIRVQAESERFEHYAMTAMLCHPGLSKCLDDQKPYEMADSGYPNVIPRQSLSITPPEESTPIAPTLPNTIRQLSDWRIGIFPTAHSSGSSRRYTPAICNADKIARALEGAIETSAVLRSFEAIHCSPHILFVLQSRYERHAGLSCPTTRCTDHHEAHDLL
ncbi:uncharacterized protein I303_105358 [Kwoniella dejecticola CBS 10117]|uniref:Uncharacterized protein n=1 Tax=Kwoniella dejecticola CBS 10117 TaxID=1296121 RepID=A0AAJ8MGQ9_9TREE